jgi:hypothetical protein
MIPLMPRAAAGYKRSWTSSEETQARDVMSVESISFVFTHSSQGVTAATHSSSDVLGMVERQATLHNGDGLYRAIMTRYEWAERCGRHIDG